MSQVLGAEYIVTRTATVSIRQFSGKLLQNKAYVALKGNLTVQDSSNTSANPIVSSRRLSQHSYTQLTMNSMYQATSTTINTS
ncbi:predicted protein [Sclerotinia sclerotiorum 1980 UF-70]|uniref:Uncharacterized protein n=1 Tax=Sclerotinia sclerotiorum (strain ATCC 18683 / 1980 / Ss-1) TaxID=665079 RepID=A7EU29_SCLS1|nr:predicted protein [Sclerotinia sclerotiorum 1980 UF-70]EDN92971.1 predicted protein [Sclerotinia sclerotiorum 1980 UF-70]